MYCYDVHEVADTFSLQARIGNRANDEAVTVAEYNDLVKEIAKAFEYITSQFD